MTSREAGLFHRRLRGRGPPGPASRATGDMMASRYDEVYGAWRRDPQGFWAEAAEDVHWSRKWDKVLDADRAPFYRWFAGGELNTCYNAVDRHVEGGRGDQAAIIYDSPVTDTVRSISYAELRAETARCAGVLTGLGIGRGDRVIIYMPMVPETVVAMLACARIGAIHSVVFGGFAANELATRIDDAKPKAILSASCGIEPGRVVAYKPLLDSAIEIARHKPESCVILQRPEERASMAAAREPGLERGHGRRDAVRRLRQRRGDRSALHPLHLRHDRHSQGRRARQWRPSGGAEMVDEEHLRGRSRRGLLGGVRRRLGGRPLLHRLRAPCSTAAAPSSTKASPSGPRTRVRSGA